MATVLRSWVPRDYQSGSAFKSVINYALLITLVMTMALWGQGRLNAPAKSEPRAVCPQEQAWCSVALGALCPLLELDVDKEAYACHGRFFPPRMSLTPLPQLCSAPRPPCHSGRLTFTSSRSPPHCSHPEPGVPSVFGLSFE